MLNVRGIAVVSAEKLEELLLKCMVLPNVEMIYRNHHEDPHDIEDMVSIRFSVDKELKIRKNRIVPKGLGPDANRISSSSAPMAMNWRAASLLRAVQAPQG